MPAGRPSDYKPEYCERVIASGKLGKSRAWIAADLDVHRDTLYEWERTHPEFSDAMDRAKLHSQSWWEDKGQEGMDGKKIDGGIWSRSMAARFPDDWREKSEVDVNVNDLAGVIAVRRAKVAALNETSDA